MILVTGGTGLLGSHLLYSLVNSGKPVRAIKRASSDISEVKKVFSYYSKSAEDLFSKIEWLNADILDLESLDEAFRDITNVYHAAAMISFDPRDKKRMIHNNQSGTANIVDACLKHNIKKLVHVSSSSALGGSVNDEEVTEDHMWSSDDAKNGYSISKFVSEMEVWKGAEEGLNMVIVNPSVIFGPGFWTKGSSSMFTKIQKGLRFYTNGVTGFVGVNDVVKSMISLMNSDASGERFIVSSENISYKKVFEMIAKDLNVRIPNIEASPFLGAIAWRVDAFLSLFGFKRILTKEAVLAGRNLSFFSNKKIVEKIGIQFTPIAEVIKMTAKHIK